MARVALPIASRLQQLLQHLINAKARGLLPRWELLEGGEKLPNEGLGWHEHIDALRPLEWVSTQVEQLR